MSKYLVGEHEYQCEGCEFGPKCPRHKMRVTMDISTDFYIVEVDGIRTNFYHENYVHALLKCLGEKA